MKFLIKLITVWVTLALIFIGSLFIINNISIASIKNNIEESVNTLNAEGLYPVSFGNKYSSLTFLIRDQYTDCLMLNEAASGDSHHALKSAILSPCLKSGRGVDMMPDDLKQVAERTMSSNVNYDWYWHGYLVILKPLLLVFGYAGIRVFNCVLMLALVSLSLFLIRKRLGNAIAIITAGILLAIHYEVVPYTMQYFSVFFVAFLSVSVLLAFPSFFGKDKNDYYFFFIIGGVTVFVDFLTTPIVTLGIPVLYWLLLDGSKDKIRKLILLSIMWGLGYASLWMTKWGICAISFDPSVLQNAASHADKWSGNDENIGRLGMTIGVVKKYIALVFSMNWIWGMISGIGILLLCNKKSNWFKKNGWMLIVSLMPFVWSAVLVNHNFEHFSFTWRMICISLLAMSVFVYKSVEFKKK